MKNYVRSETSSSSSNFIIHFQAFLCIEHYYETIETKQ